MITGSLGFVVKNAIRKTDGDAAFVLSVTRKHLGGAVVIVAETVVGKPIENLNKEVRVKRLNITKTKKPDCLIIWATNVKAVDLTISSHWIYTIPTAKTRTGSATNAGGFTTGKSVNRFSLFVLIVIALSIILRE